MIRCYMLADGRYLIAGGTDRPHYFVKPGLDYVTDPQELAQGLRRVADMIEHVVAKLSTPR